MIKYQSIEKFSIRRFLNLFGNFLKKNQKSVNDNDDLIPLFNSYTDLLRTTYGDFYVAEMIEAQNEDNKCLTAEVFPRILASNRFNQIFFKLYSCQKG